MRDCVQDEVKQCFRGMNIDRETIENVSQNIVKESLPDEDANVSCSLATAKAGR